MTMEERLIGDGFKEAYVPLYGDEGETRPCKNRCTLFLRYCRQQKPAKL